MELKNVPDSAHKYEFMVCEKIENELWFRGSYSDGWKAEQACQEIKMELLSITSVCKILKNNFKKTIDKQ